MARRRAFCAPIIYDIAARLSSCDARLRCSTRFASVLVRSFRSVRRARCFDLIDRVRNSRAPVRAFHGRDDVFVLRPHVKRKKLFLMTRFVMTF